MTALSRRGSSLRHQLFEHSMQVRRRNFDIEILVLASARLGRQDGTAMHLLEIALGEPVATIVAPRQFIFAEVPASEFPKFRAPR
jgi:hypothetical protein